MRRLIGEDDIAHVDAWAVEMRRLIRERGVSGPPRPLEWSDVTVAAEGRVCVWTAPRCQVCSGFGYDTETGDRCPCRGPHDGGVMWRVHALNNARIPAKCIQRTSRDMLSSTAKWVEEWQPSARGYILLSDPGTGKTHYMAAMVLAFIERGVKARMLDWPTFLRERRAALGNQIRLDAQLDIIQTAPVLCIDELARERETQWTEDVLDEVIEARYQSGRTTIIASNAKPDGFEAYMGPRLYSRLVSMARVVEFRGIDQRRAQ
jgi:hypothetical protein